MVQAIVSTSAAARLAAATAFLDRFPAGSEVLVIAATRGAADDFARALARRRGATFGLTRSSLLELAARTAARGSEQPRAPGSQAAVEAMAARAVHEALEDGDLHYFTPVARTPGFPRALARTLHELRLGRVASERLADGGAGPDDLARLMARFEQELDRAGVNDRAAIFVAAAAAWPSASHHFRHLPVVLLDVAIDSSAEQTFVGAVVRSAPAALVTVSEGDRWAERAVAAMGATLSTLSDAAPPDSDLAHLRRYVFTMDRPPERDRAGDVQLFSAPGEGREAIEIVRRVSENAARGVPFDEMAVFLRSPQQYMGLLEHACARADIPVYFERGTRRPDPAGRAFVALLTCAVERLSARRFDEYLSLGQVPRLGREAKRAQPPVRPQDDAFALPPLDADTGDDPESAVPDTPPLDTDEDAIVAGTLRSPWKWEELIVESHVVGGTTLADGRERWRRRLQGLEHDYQLRMAALQRDEPESPRLERFARDLRNLRHLRTFALPIIDAMAVWPAQSSWGEWITRFSSLAELALSRPERVLRTLADLRPMSGIDGVALEEARDVLRDRLVMLDWDPPARRYGKLFVGTPHQARGRSFRVVFVPGLAERVVPQRPREDPLLLDEAGAATSEWLLRQDDRGTAERLLLKIAIGAATERLYFSYPRMDVAETRARVPSFYALDVVRAITGRVPDHRVLAADAAEEAGASLAWPAPADPNEAIDELEHDLAVLRPLLDSRDAAAVRGRAHYLLDLNDSLARSIRSRWRRFRKTWSAADGIVQTTPRIAAAIAKHRLGARAYSLSALQRYATCPYQFLLSTIHRLEPWDEPEPLLRMDPLTRGSLFHEVQAGFFRLMQARGELPLRADRVADAVLLLETELERVAKAYAEKLAPAIDRVWQDEIAELRRDLGIWVRRLARDATWVPSFFEFSFGLSAGGPEGEGRDARSLHDPITVGDRFRLRGSVDLIERHAEREVLRITDHKTGKNRANDLLIVGGGKTLQPVLYSMAIEAGLGTKVEAGRLFYCTTAGGFGEHSIPLNDHVRQQGLQVLEIIDRALGDGFLPVAPEKDACRWCDFRPVCGPRQGERVQQKDRARLADLEALRSMR